MAEALLNHLGSFRFQAESAGFEPAGLNPLAIEAMKEIGLDISRNKTKSISDACIKDKSYDYVITVCGEAESEKCPVFHLRCKKLHWGFNDPSSFKGLYEERFQKTCEVRDAIKYRIEQWIQTFG